MSPGKKIALFLAALLLYGAGAAADTPGTPPSAVPCDNKNMDGIYVLIYFDEDPPGKEAKWRSHFKYGYISIKSTASIYEEKDLNTQLTTSVQAQKTFSSLGSYRQYAMGTNGTLQLSAQNNKYHTYVCRVVPAGDGNFQKGDLILTGLSEGSGHKLYKLYRHWF